jgi:hypothetical protein
MTKQRHVPVVSNAQQHAAAPAMAAARAAGAEIGAMRFVNTAVMRL